jgi:hypothetical protein
MTKSYLGRHRFLSVLLLCSGLFLVACTDPSTGTATRPAVVSTAQRSLPAAARTILLDGGETPGVQALLDGSVQAIVRRCMNAQHLRYFPTASDTREPSVSDLPEFPAYGTLATRQADGYGEFTTSTETADNQGGMPADEEDRYVRSLQPAAQARYSEALFGPVSSDRAFALPGAGPLSEGPTGGCQGTAESELDGSVARYMEAVEGPGVLRLILTRQVESSPRFTAAMTAWSRCMSGRGFQYGSPWNAWNDFADRFARQGVSSGLRRRETRVAVADWECASTVGLVSVTIRLQERCISALSATLRTDLLEISSIEALAIARAHALRRA